MAEAGACEARIRGPRTRPQVQSAPHSKCCFCRARCNANSHESFLCSAAAKKRLAKPPKQRNPLQSATSGQLKRPKRRLSRKAKSWCILASLRFQKARGWRVARKNSKRSSRKILSPKVTLRTRIEGSVRYTHWQETLMTRQSSFRKLSTTR